MNRICGASSWGYMLGIKIENVFREMYLDRVTLQFESGPDKVASDGPRLLETITG